MYDSVLHEHCSLAFLKARHPGFDREDTGQGKQGWPAYGAKSGSLHVSSPHHNAIRDSYGNISRIGVIRPDRRILWTKCVRVVLYIVWPTLTEHEE